MIWLSTLNIMSDQQSVLKNIMGPLMKISQIVFDWVHEYYSIYYCFLFF